MDKRAFKQRMQNLKSYRENNPGKGYWDWKVETFADGGVNDNLVGSYSNHTGTPTMYVPVTKEYEAVPEGFGEIANVHTPEVTITPQSNISLIEAVDKGRRDAAPYVGAIVAGATLPAMSSTNMLGKAIDLANIVLDPTNPANYVKIPNIKLGRWSAKFPEYGNQNKAFRQINVDAVDDYINTGVVGPESKAHNAMRSAQNANKNSGGGSKHLLTLLTKHFDTHVMFNKTKPFYGKDSKYPRALVGDLRNPRINWKKVNHKGHKNIVEPVDPSTGNFTVPIEEFDIWRKAKIGWLRDQKANRFAEGGQTGDPEKERFYQATGRSSSGRPLEEGLKPVFSLEDAANMTPIGDAISAKDAYDAVKNRDWLGAGLAAVTMIPFVPTTVRNFRKKYKGITPKREIPTVNKKAIDNAIDEAKNYRDSRIKLYQQAIEDRNASYERLIENEDALRRAVNFDKKYGTNYVKTYTNDLMQIGIKPMGANGSFDPNIPDYVFINSDYVKNGKLQPGLISHEKSHYDNQKAGALSLPIFDNRFVDTKKTKTMYPKTYDWIQRYLHNFEETKSHMNEFRTNMINKNLLKPDSKVGLKQIKDLIFNSDNDNMKKLFNTYKSKRQFVKDFNSVPITSIGDNKTLV